MCLALHYTIFVADVCSSSWQQYELMTAPVVSEETSLSHFSPAQSIHSGPYTFLDTFSMLAWIASAHILTGMLLRLKLQIGHKMRQKIHKYNPSSYSSMKC